MYYRFILEVVALWAACYFLPPEPVATGLESCALYDNVFDANASPEIMADLIPTDNFKSRICKMQFNIYREYKYHRSLYSVLGIEPCEESEDKMFDAFRWQAVQALIRHHEQKAECVRQHQAAQASTNDHDDNAYKCKFANKAQDMLFATYLNLSDSEVRQRYNQEFFIPSRLVVLDAREHNIEAARRIKDALEWTHENNKMRLQQPEVDVRLREICRGYVSDEEMSLNPLVRIAGEAVLVSEVR